MLDRLDGLAALRAICDGCAPSCAFARLLKFRIVCVSEGKVTFEATPSVRYNNYTAIIHGGFTMALLDSALGAAVKSTLPAEATYRTIDLHARLLRPITDKTGTVTCEGRVVSRTRSLATTAGEVVDSGGRLLATATAACVIRANLRTLRSQGYEMLV